VNITTGDETELLNALFIGGPVSVSYHVADGFSDYTTGVYTAVDCPNDALSVNHAVTLVGYGVDQASGLNYWLIKNSWGTEWGDNGYFKMQRDVNMCAIAVCNSYP